MEHFFRVLGLPPSASLAEVREAYKDLVRVWHPDRFSSDPRLRGKAEERLKEINEAYERIIATQSQQYRTDSDASLQATAPTIASSAHHRRRRSKIVIVVVAVFLTAVIIYVLAQRSEPEDISRSSLNSGSAVSSPSPTATATPTLTLGQPSPTQSPNQYDDLLDGLSPEATATPVLPSTDEPATRPRMVTSPQPTTNPERPPAPSPRVENVVSAYDVMTVGYTRSQDSRRYRFRLDGIARLKGAFSSQGGGVTVRIISTGGASTYYSSGSDVSADKIDVALYAGTYELEVVLTMRGVVSFQVDLRAHYN